MTIAVIACVCIHALVGKRRCRVQNTTPLIKAASLTSDHPPYRCQHPYPGAVRDPTSLSRALSRSDQNRTAQRHLKELKEVRGLDGRLAEPLRADEHCRCPQHLFAAAPARLDDGHVLFEGLHGASELLQLILLEEEWRETSRD